MVAWTNLRCGLVFDCGAVVLVAAFRGEGCRLLLGMDREEARRLVLWIAQVCLAVREAVAMGRVLARSQGQMLRGLFVAPWGRRAEVDRYMFVAVEVRIVVAAAACKFRDGK